MSRTHHQLITFALALSLVLGAGFAAITVSPATAQAQDKGANKFAYVDLQRALNEVEEGKKAKKKLKGMFNKRQKELDAKQEPLKTFKEKLEGELKSDLLSDDKKREKMMDYQKQFYELQTLYATLQKELTQAEAKETKKIFAKMRDILKGIGLKEGYTMILEKTESSILWAPQSMDITDVLIQKYNSGK